MERWLLASILKRHDTNAGWKPTKQKANQGRLILITEFRGDSFRTIVGQEPF
jgi:hypothetical protein